MPTIQNRRATAAQWTSANPVLAAGEIGFELDTNALKVGDGLTAWETLPYLSDESLKTLVESGRLSEAVLNDTYATRTTLSREYTPATGAPVTTIAAPIIMDGVRNYNSAPFQQDSVLIRDGYLYTTLIGRGRNVMIARKPLVGGTWETFNITTMPNSPIGVTFPDGHNVVTLGIDSLGYIHVVGNLHGQPMRYVRSVNPYDLSEFAVGVMVGTDEGHVTYPQFFTAGNGDLMLMYRDGNPDGAGTILNKVPTGQTAWARVGKLFAETGYPPYIDRITVGEDGAFHMFGCWRIGATADTNGDIFYLRSLDNGVTWQTVDGTVIAQPMKRATVPVIYQTPPSGSGLINQTGTCVDAFGNPHKSFWMYDDDGNTQFHHIWHDGEDWQVEQVTNFTTRIDMSVPMIAADLSRGGMVATPEGRSFLMYRQNSDGLKGTLRLKDVTPAEYGIPNVGDFPILSIDTWYADPSPVVSGGKLLVLATVTGPDTVGHEDQPSEDLWSAQSATITMVELAAIPALAAAPLAARVETLGSVSLPSPQPITAYTPAPLSMAPASVPPRTGDKLLVARVYGSATASGSDAADIEVISKPTVGVGTVLARTRVSPGAGKSAEFFTPWAPLDLHYGDWHRGGSVIARARTDGGTLTINHATVEVGVGVAGDGSLIPGPTEQVPVGGFVPAGALLADWDASNITGVADGGQVTLLPDTAYGLDLTPTLGTPTLAADGIGGQPAVVFTGGQCLQSAAVNVGHTYTVFVVGVSSAATVQTLVSQDTSVGGLRNFQAQVANATTVKVVGFQGKLAGVEDTATGDTQSPFIMEAVRAQLSATAYTMEAVINGASNGTTASTPSDLAAPTTWVDLGARSDGANKQYLTGRIAKVMIFRGALSPGERAVIRAQLAARYGITVT